MRVISFSPRAARNTSPRISSPRPVWSTQERSRRPVGAVLSLAELRTAHEMVEDMRTRPRGKIVLKS
jgi:hypothetical protein